MWCSANDTVLVFMNKYCGSLSSETKADLQFVPQKPLCKSKWNHQERLNWRVLICSLTSNAVSYLWRHLTRHIIQYFTFRFFFLCEHFMSWQTARKTIIIVAIAFETVKNNLISTLYSHLCAYIGFRCLGIMHHSAILILVFRHFALIAVWFVLFSLCSYFDIWSSS